ncbi:MAG: DUF4365 domain-containing protein [Pyrinomonadaceae bacterium]
MMDINQRKEQFSKAFIHGIATIAGYTIQRPDVDDDSIDLVIAARGGGSTLRRPRIELQLKCTHVDDGDTENLGYDLKIKNYDDLRVDTIVPRILVVVLVPEDVNSWLRLTPDEMCLRRCAYWHSLFGFPETSNTDTVRVHLARTASFSPESLRRMMERVNLGEQP